MKMAFNVLHEYKNVYMFVFDRCYERIKGFSKT